MDLDKYVLLLCAFCLSFTHALKVRTFYSDEEHEEDEEDDLFDEFQDNIKHRRQMKDETNQKVIFADSLPPPPPPLLEAPKCTIPVNVGFLLDSSASLIGYYQTEKNFLKAVADAFELSEFGSRASVITFSKRTSFSIKFKDGTNATSFKSQVDAIPFMRSYTRIDLALRLALEEMFKEENGALPYRPNVLFLLTDGVQSRRRGYEEPSLVAKEIRHRGIIIISVGIGDGVYGRELSGIAGHHKHVFHASTFTQLMGWEFIDSLTSTSCGFAMIPSMPKCDRSVNLGFVLDASASLVGFYQKEKDFIKSVADAFDIIEDGSKASVVTFSKTAHLSITFKQGNDLDDFNEAVDAIPFLRSYTRIDRALRLTQKVMFTDENGFIPNRPKVLFLVTDGMQSKRRGYEDPAKVAQELRDDKEVVFVGVGVGDGVDDYELAGIVGESSHVFHANDFEDLLRWRFIKDITEKSCSFSHQIP